MRREHVALFACVLLLSATLYACPRGQNTRKPVDSVFPTGRAALVERVTVLTERQPIQDTPMLARTLFRGEPGRALARGTVVVRLGADDPELRATSAQKRVDMQLNPWVFVRIEDTSLQGQRSWKGWIHTDDLALIEGTFPKAGSQPDGFLDKVLKKPGKLCKDPLSTATCPHTTHPSLFVRFLGCEGEFVDAEMWDPSGLYISGFIQRDDFIQDPCAIR